MPSDRGCSSKRRKQTKKRRPSSSLSSFVGVNSAQGTRSTQQHLQCFNLDPDLLVPYLFPRRCLRPPFVNLATMALPNCKLTYFPLAGRGEAIRLALTIGGIKFTDERIPFPEWAALKPTTPWGSMPILTLSTGEKLAQQRAVLRFVGKEVGLYPTDNLKAALVDGLMDAVEDVASTTNNAGRGLPKEEKEAARAAAVAKGGAVYTFLEKVDKFIADNGSGGYSVGDSMTIADLFLFANCGALVSGLYDGVPLDAIDSDFPNIMAVRKTVRSHAAVAKYYESVETAASYGPF